MPSDSLFVKCKTCDNEIPKKSKTCPKCGSKNKKKLKAFHWVGIVFVTLIIIGMVSSPDTSINQTEKNKPSTAISKNKKSSSLLEFQPEEQIRFIQAVTDYSEKFSSAKNELQQSVLRDERKAAIERSVYGHSISSWIGTISRLQTNSDGKAIVSIAISPRIEIQTWNNALSDIGSNTLIEKSTSLYSSLLQLRKGQMVEFSGKFFSSDTDYLKETSMTIDGSMRSPEFLFSFRSIKPIT